MAGIDVNRYVLNHVVSLEIYNNNDDKVVVVKRDVRPSAAAAAG